MGFFDLPGGKSEPKKERVTTKYTPSKPVVKPFQPTASLVRSRPTALPASPRSSTTPEASSSRLKARLEAERTKSRSSNGKRGSERDSRDEGKVMKKRKRAHAESESSSEDDDLREKRASAKQSRRTTPVWQETHIARVPLAERDLFDMSRLAGDGKRDVEGFVHSADIVRDSSTQYVAYFEQDGFAAADSPVVTLSYPRKGCRERFSLLSPRARGEYSPINDLLRAIQLMVAIYVPSTHSAIFGASDAHAKADAEQGESSATEQDTILRSLDKAFNRRDGPAFVSAVERFNTTFERLLDSEEASPQVDEDKWIALVAGIGEQVYQRQVGPGTVGLSEYEPFSDNVYGELLPRFMTEILTRFPMNGRSLFLDLGSGVSNLTIQASLQAGCKSLGCEQMANPAQMAIKQIEEAKRRWRMWCVKGNADCRAVEGDFCASDEVRRALPKADLVLVNNYAFTPSLNDRLSLLFLDLKDGARIISLKPFLSKDFRLTERTAASPLAILKMRQLDYPSNSVSWTENGGVYYECVIDRTAIREFFEKGTRRGR